jgi:hypothetical protein
LLRPAFGKRRSGWALKSKVIILYTNHIIPTPICVLFRSIDMNMCNPALLSSIPKSPALSLSVSQQLHSSLRLSAAHPLQCLHVPPSSTTCCVYDRKAGCQGEAGFVEMGDALSQPLGLVLRLLALKPLPPPGHRFLVSFSWPWS